MKSRKFDVFGLGQCALDYLAPVTTHPPVDSKCEFKGLVVQGGGPVATALVALSRWGIKCAFAGVIGDDSFGTAIKESLAMEVVDLQSVLTRKGESSQFAFVASEKGTGFRTIFWRRPTGPELAPAELNQDIIRSAKMVHTDGLFMEASLFAARAARNAGRIVSVDAGTMREGMLDLARESNIFIASERFAISLSGDGEGEDACRTLADLGPEIVGVTLGKRGYVALIKGNIIRGQAREVKVLDTTGCGDVFHAGFIYGHMKGWKPEKSLDFAAWAAAMVAGETGGRKGIPKAENYPGDR